MVLQIKEEFTALHPGSDGRLRDKWPRYREAVLHQASLLPTNSDLQEILCVLDNCEDEGLQSL